MAFILKLLWINICNHFLTFLYAKKKQAVIGLEITTIATEAFFFCLYSERTEIDWAVLWHYYIMDFFSQPSQLRHKMLHSEALVTLRPRPASKDFFISSFNTSEFKCLYFQTFVLCSYLNKVKIILSFTQQP